MRRRSSRVASPSDPPSDSDRAKRKRSETPVDSPGLSIVSDEQDIAAAKPASDPHSPREQEVEADGEQSETNSEVSEERLQIVDDYYEKEARRSVGRAIQPAQSSDSSDGEGVGELVLFERELESDEQIEEEEDEQGIENETLDVLESLDNTQSTQRDSNFGHCRCFDDSFPPCWRMRSGVRYHDGDCVYISSASPGPHLIAKVVQVHDRIEYDNGSALVSLFPRAADFATQAEGVAGAYV
jgi:hypothetical protein